jgi:large conductance mechanosensitive channel
MGMLKEFKEFAMRGNVVDMAVGIIIGGAFGKIVSSLVSDVIMPPIGKLIGGVNFSELKFSLGQSKQVVDGKEVIKEAFVNYGAFIQTVFDFLIIALAIFFMIKAMNRATAAMQKEEAPKEPTTKDCPKCCSSIPIKATRCPNCTSELEAA